MPSVASFLYNGILKRSPTMLLVAIVGAVFCEAGIDYIGDEAFNRYNQGKLWDHIKHRYVKEA